MRIAFIATAVIILLPASGLTNTATHLNTPDFDRPAHLQGPSKSQTLVIQKLLHLTNFAPEEAANAMSHLHKYGQAYRATYAQENLTDAQRRVRIMEARRQLEQSLRASMNPNDIRKWLHYSIPAAPSGLGGMVSGL